MMESVEFSITLSSQYTEQSGVPMIEIFLDDECIVGLTVINKQKTITFTLELGENKSHKLCLRRSGHDEINEQSVTIEKITVDKIDLKRHLDHVCFYPVYPKDWYNDQVSLNNTPPEMQKGWSTFGFNGTWEMPFTTPFYTWLLGTV